MIDTSAHFPLISTLYVVGITGPIGCRPRELILYSCVCHCIRIDYSNYDKTVSSQRCDKAPRVEETAGVTAGTSPPSSRTALGANVADAMESACDVDAVRCSAVTPAAPCAGGGGSVAPSSAAATPMRVSVIEGDCVAAAIALRGRGFRVAMLNMANAYSPGGAWENGAGAQEENLHRRSDLYAFLEDSKGMAWKSKGRRCYPIPKRGALYVSHVP